MARVLLVEDDSGIRAAVRLMLEDEGYDVVEAATGEEGIERFRAGGADLAIVDLLLPGIGGLDVVRALRATSGLPILVVTAQADSHDVVAGLEAGADDYVTKPFVPKELAARVRAQLRRVQREVATPAGTTMRVRDLEISPGAGEVLREGQPLTLTKTEFRLLVELAEHAGHVISRDQLLERVWGWEYVGDGRLVDTHLYRLRAKIEDDPANPQLLVTVRGLGYKLMP
ncbi:MAG TPA: response regulator transcription factor [Acidimicrobiales bacterium]|nr:response regulator transcription factor [Acidimicrobiales bacterium]